MVLARKVHARDLSRARAREKAAAEKLRRKTQRREKLARRARKARPRVEVRTAPGERALVFHGPHASNDLWVTTMIIGFSFVLPVWIGLLFWHWLASLAAIVVTVGPWLLYVYSPVIITVTDNGYFDARRPFLPHRDVGHLDELVLEVEVDRYSEGGLYRTCSIESRRLKLWTAKDLTARDARTIEDFKISLVAAPPKAPHDGGYRVAA